MTQWQHLYLHEHANMHNLFDMMQWCSRRHGDPIILPQWVENRLQCSAHASSWDQTLGGWTRDWRHSGYSLYHPNPRFWAQVKQGFWDATYLELFPLCVLFYNREDLTEFKLIWS